MTLLSLLRKLAVRKKGAAAIEFALVAPVFFLLMFGIVEFGLTAFLDSTMQQALRTAARQCMVKQERAGQQPVPCDETVFRQALQQYMQGFYKPEKIGLYVQAVPNLLNTGACCTPHPAISSFWTDPESFFQPKPYPTNVQQSGYPIMIYGMEYQWGGFTGIMSPFIPEKMYAVTIVRNEF